ncbi:MAG: ACT domain-containing protein [Endomicrobiaceae bacterium]|nr:ACT domain-containing protein [Endomicrobiaceae bacterium]
MPYHISVFLVNSPGKLEKITKILADNNINLRAMSLASSGDFGVMKLLVNDPDKAFEVLKQSQLTVTKRQIIAIVVDNQPGSFNKLLNKLTKKGLNIEDCYGFLLNDGKTAAIILEIENQPNAEQLLSNIGCDVLTEEQLYN